MKKQTVFLILISMCFATCGTAQKTAKVKITSSDDSSVTKKDGWKLVWSDEFNYNGLPDSTKWIYDTEGNSSGWGNREDQFYTIRIDSEKNIEKLTDKVKEVIQQKAEPVKNVIKSTAQDMSEDMKKTGQDANADVKKWSEKIKSTGQDIKKEAEDLSRKAVSTAKDAWKGLKEGIDEVRDKNKK